MGISRLQIVIAGKELVLTGNPLTPFEASFYHQEKQLVPTGTNRRTAVDKVARNGMSWSQLELIPSYLRPAGYQLKINMEELIPAVINAQSFGMTAQTAVQARIRN